MPSSVMQSGCSLAFSTASALYRRTKNDSSVAMQTSSPPSFQNIYIKQVHSLVDQKSSGTSPCQIFLENDMQQFIFKELELETDLNSQHFYFAVNPMDLCKYSAAIGSYCRPCG